MKWEKKLTLLDCIAADLHIIHNQGFIHRDLHSGNILLNSLHSAYIADLGLSTLANTGSNDKVQGVLPYMAPEVLSNNDYSMESDIYSFGIIAYEIVSGQLAYYNVPHDIQLAREIMFGLRPRIPENVPKLINEFINKCWSAQLDKRPTAEEIRNTIHSWNLFLNDKSTELFAQIKSADEIQETLLISDVSTPFPFIIDYASRQFDFLPLRNDTNNNG
ncbi:kinase-like domain-containing protein [Gigaspora rosea]|uniref:Kinase-like domain-containing protein n=1 Tax=Gigaspora rosea TaxID=44941 RepID=A0A397TV15_9GLOM|nr:kinase-like domain-containing protein [Gigaspora rosea]